MRALGLDTSGYTTSAAVFDGESGVHAARLLAVPAGELGLRQSEALFQHVKALPDRLEELRARGALHDIGAVCASTRPRAAEGSYMPCFLPGESLGRALAAALDAPFFPVSHQQGHLAAAAWSAGRLDLLDAPFLAWHLSGGTTELLYVEPEGANVRAAAVGGTTDLSAGQLIDRVGVSLGLAFPAGKELDRLSGSCTQRAKPFPVKLHGLRFSLSGVENQARALADRGAAPETTAAFTLDTLADLVHRATRAARRERPGLPVLCAGGVASNSRLREALADCGALFAQPEYSTDNAMGAAILGCRLAGQEKKE